MEEILGNIFGVILIVAFPIGFVLFLQFLSKASGKTIVRKYTGDPIASPDDFDSSIDALKKASEDLNFYIKKFNLSHVEQVVFKLEKVLRKPPVLSFKSYYNNKINLEKLIKKIVANGKITEKDLLQRISQPLSSLTHDWITDKETEEKLRKCLREHRNSLNTFNQVDLETIQSFMLPALNNNHDDLIEFLDRIGRTNFKEFADIINMMESMYISSKITKDQIDNIKLMILKKKGLVDALI